jgi:predicted MPP superfamily phosphohydrolase
MIVVYAVAAAAAALDALAASLVLLWGRAPIGVARMVLAALLSSAFFVAKTVVLLALIPASSFFALILFAYVYLAVSLPLSAIALLMASRWRKVSGLVRVAAALALLGAPAAVWGSLIEPFRLQVEEVAVPLAAERDGEAPIRIGVLADIQARAVSDFERGAVARLMALAPDLILIPGDLAQVWPRSTEESVGEFRALLAQLDAPLGVWMVRGNTDSLDVVGQAIEGTRVRLLQDERVELAWKDRRIVLCGIDMDFRSSASRAAAAELEALSGSGDVRILIAHYPDAYRLLDEPARTDLLIAGHTHGGQVQIPFFGPPITLSGVPRHVAAGGLHELDGRRIYVSRGLGAERGWAPRLRFLCPPEITLLTLGEASKPAAGAAAGLQARGGVPQASQ